MPEETVPVVMKPGDKYHPDGTYPKTNRLGWARLADEVTREVENSFPWTVGPFEDHHMKDRAIQFGAPDKPLYLAEYAPSTSNKYLDYEGHYGGIPVNQVPYLRKWKPYVARAEHDFDLTMNSHAMSELNENERWTVENQMHGLIGASWFILDVLEGVDPSTVDSRGNRDWETYRDDADAILAGLCHECDHGVNYARYFAFKANLELFRGALISGKVHESDQDVEPWGLDTNIVTQVLPASGTTASEESITNFHKANKVEARKAMLFFHTDVAHAVIPHEHE